MDPMLTLAIAASRQGEMQATAATERLAAELRRGRPRRQPIAGLALAAVLGRVRDTRPVAAPCPTC